MMESTYDKIKHGMELAFFACAYADLREEEGEPLRGEIMNQLPDIIDPAAKHAADTLTQEFLTYFNFKEKGLTDKQKLNILYMKAGNLQDQSMDKGDREITPELFGHYLAMQAMGTGVGLESFGSDVRDGFTVPHIEFGSHSLQYDYD